MSGKKTSTKETRKQARAWMVLHDIRIMDIKAALGMKTHVPISFTLSGVKHNRKVLAYLLGEGCPAEFLDLPNDMRKPV